MKDVLGGLSNSKLWLKFFLSKVLVAYIALWKFWRTENSLNHGMVTHWNDDLNC